MIRYVVSEMIEKVAPEVDSMRSLDSDVSGVTTITDVFWANIRDSESDKADTCFLQYLHHDPR